MTTDVKYSPSYTPRVHNGSTENLLSSTTKMLDSLISYYQQERMWVYRMRAQEACTPQLIDERPDQVQQAQPDSTSDFSMGSSVESHSVDEGSSPDGQTRWMHRKRGFKLRLEGIRSKGVTPLQFVQEQSVEDLQPREQILEKFEKMMEARMESCQRVNKLVQEASRANAQRSPGKYTLISFFHRR